MAQPPQWLPSSDGRRDSTVDIMSLITAAEVKHQYKRLPSNSSPGPDGLDYKAWKLLSGSKEALEVVFNICLTNGKIPQSWKSNTTILIYKKGDPSIPSNWRPIALQNTIYKIYAAILDNRLASWCIDTNAISPMKKGFLLFEGCYEHLFIMQSLFDDSKHRNKDLRLVWFDLKNALGSIPQDKMFEMMKRLGNPDEFPALCKNIRFYLPNLVVQSQNIATNSKESNKVVQ